MDAAFLSASSFSSLEVFSDLNEMGGLSTEERRHVDLRRDKVQEALNTARSALRKWEAVPRRWLTLSQYRLRKQVQKSFLAELGMWANVELFVGFWMFFDKGGVRIFGA